MSEDPPSRFGSPADEVDATPRGWRRWGRDPVALTALAAFALVTLAFAIHAAESWTSHFDGARRRLVLINDFAARTVDAVLDQLQSNLQALGPTMIEPDGGLRPERIERAVRQLQHAHPGLDRVGVVAADGTELFSTGAAPPGGPFADAALRHTFDAAAEHPGLFVGRTLRNPDGRWVIPIRHAVRDEAGTVRLFIAAGLAASERGPLFRNVELPEGYGLRLLREDGYAQIVVPLPGPPERVYTEPLPAAIRAQMAAIGAGESGSFDADRGLDGRVRLGAFKRLADAPLVSVVSMPRDLVAAAWRRDMRAVGALYLALAAGLFGVARFAHRARERAEQALRESQRRFRDFAEASADWYWETDPEGRFTAIGDSVEQHTRLAAPAYIGKARWELVGNFDPPDAELWRRHRDDLAARRPFRHLRYGGRRADGEARYFDISGRPFFDGDGRLLGYRGVGSDITELTRAQDALRHATERLALVFRSSPVAITLMRMDGTFLEVNDAFGRLFGWPRDLIVGRTAAQLQVWVDGEVRERFVQTLTRDGRLAGFEAQARRRTGEVYDCEVSAELVDEDGEQLLLAIVQDVTERRRAERALREIRDELELRVQARTHELSLANRELEAFVYSVSHDLRAPLRGIDGFAQPLDDRYGAALDEPGRNYLQRVRAGTRRMGRLIDDLLALSRVRRAELKLQRVDLSAMARSIADELGRTEPQRQVRWHIEPGLAADADPGLIHVVLANLLGNAWKYTGKTADAEIRVEGLGRQDGRDEFCVRDNGAGFDMAHAHQLFQPFRRLHGQHEFEGTGVGLATVQRVIERHGGTVRAEARVGQGASFFFSLPAQGART